MEKARNLEPNERMALWRVQNAVDGEFDEYAIRGEVLAAVTADANRGKPCECGYSCAAWRASADKCVSNEMDEMAHIFALDDENALCGRGLMACGDAIEIAEYEGLAGDDICSACDAEYAVRQSSVGGFYPNPNASAIHLCAIDPPIMPAPQIECKGCHKTLSPQQVALVLSYAYPALCWGCVSQRYESGAYDDETLVVVSADYIHRVVTGLVRYDE